jgi:hypothetical protein
MDTIHFSHSETVTVPMSPEDAYDLIADVTRIGEWSPVCTSAAWEDDDHVWFLGTNTIPGRVWVTRCRVDVAVRGREFTYVMCGREGEPDPLDLVQWSYTFVAAPGGTDVTEHWHVLTGYETSLHRVIPDLDADDYLDGFGVKPSMQQGIADTLANLKAYTERVTASR